MTTIRQHKAQDIQASVELPRKLYGDGVRPPVSQWFCKQKTVH